ncbi:hypothetical protein [Cryptosporangium aurantiacum]|uniref:Uncharacterized protein n=1 Tax=Cryptosporangium aurantiacum TaxID=134849 RepID=A0A1M7RNY9_9ACTN|nr:hypothetical protein [Cryptosporangium aurantiacum]SHN47974.1 hypothetical protein SAMN05443668_13121 [Cryptosporangium aurantiacum]
MASARQLIRTDRGLDRIVAGLLAIGAVGDLYGAYRYLGEVLRLHDALRVGDGSVENLDPGTALPTVYVLGGFALGFAVLSGLVAVLIVRGMPVGLAALRGGVAVLLPAQLLAFLATYIRYQEYVDAMPPQTRDPAYQSAITGQVFGTGVGAAGAAAAVVVLLGAALVRWFRPRTESWPVPAGRRPESNAPIGSSAAALNVARILALAGTAIVMLVPVAWVRPLNHQDELPPEWSLLSVISGLLAVAALVGAGLAILARPGRLLFRWFALGVLALVAAVVWAVTLWQAFYADVAYGTERVDGVAVAWTAAIICGLVGSALLTAAVVTLTLPGDPPEPAEEPVKRPKPERIGESSPEPAWQAFPEKSAATRKRKKPKRKATSDEDATRTAGPESESR